MENDSKWHRIARDTYENYITDRSYHGENHPTWGELTEDDRRRWRGIAIRAVTSAITHGLVRNCATRSRRTG